MKRLKAKVGEYERDGQTKGRYVDVGVEMQNDRGAYLLLDPTVNHAGILALQNAMAVKSGQQPRDRVMVSVFEDSRQQPRQTNYQAPPQQSIDDDIPF